MGGQNFEETLALNGLECNNGQFLRSSSTIPSLRLGFLVRRNGPFCGDQAAASSQLFPRSWWDRWPACRTHGKSKAAVANPSILQSFHAVEREGLANHWCCLANPWCPLHVGSRSHQ